ncbi:methyltransferase domain-containing protein [Thiohalorhabdus sp.]|uniref:methyltransferase domain-containing protein n=1 Tax=Thiohalorhabdus sp. TaxID=3094134 RepID=UPI002FC2EF53
MANSSEPWPKTTRAPFDKTAVRRDFARAAATYDRHAPLQARVAGRVADLYVERVGDRQGTVLDLGSGTGLVGRSLAAQGLLAQHLLALDLAHAMTRSGRRAGQPGITGDAEALPLAPQSLDAVVSSLTLQWVNQLPSTLGEVARCLRPGGLLVASTLATGTLAELENALRAMDGRGGVGPFRGRQALARALASSGLHHGACWVETETLHAPRPRAVLRDLKGLGAVDKSPERSRGLHGRNRLARLEQAYRHACGVGEGPVPVTWRVAYLVAWKPR